MAGNYNLPVIGLPGIGLPGIGIPGIGLLGIGLPEIGLPGISLWMYGLRMYNLWAQVRVLLPWNREWQLLQALLLQAGGSLGVPRQL